MAAGSGESSPRSPAGTEARSCLNSPELTFRKTLPCLSLLTALPETILSPDASQQRACAVGAASRGSLCPSSPFTSVGELVTEIGLPDPTKMKEAALCVTSARLYMKTQLRPPGAKSISRFYVGICLGTSSVLAFLS